MPFKNQLHVDQQLSNVSIKYTNKSLIANEIFPTVPVKKDSDLYRVYDRNFKLPETIRASSGEARQWDFEVSTASYVLKQHSLKAFVSDRDAENYDLTSLMADQTENLTDTILLRQEKDVADLMTSTSWSQNASLTAAQQWDGTTTANPITMVDTATGVVLENSGQVANVCLLPWRVLMAAKNNTQVIDRIKYTSSDITPSMIAGLFDKEKLLVPKAVIDSAALGVAASIAPLFSDNALIAHVADSPGPLKPSAGYIFKNALPMVKRWRVEERQSECVEVNLHYSAKVVASLSGYLLKDILA
jgi:hypothetical protein